MTDDLTRETSMTDDLTELAERLREMAESMYGRTGSTHSAACWQWHDTCALLAAADLLADDSVEAPLSVSSYEFALLVEGFDMEDDATLDLLYETFESPSAGFSAGRTTVEFLVDAESWDAALLSTVVLFARTFPEVRVLGLDSDVALLDGDR